MTDLAQLKRWISEKSRSQRNIAHTLGLSEASLSRKLNGYRKFTQKDIAKFREIGMSQKDILSIFLS